LTYGSDAASTHLTYTFWYLDTGDLLPFDPTKADAKNSGFVTRWKLQKQSRERNEGRIHICNVPKFLNPGVKLQIKFTKARSIFFLINTSAHTKNAIKFVDAKIFVKRIRPNPRILVPHIYVLNRAKLPSYNLTTVELKTVTFSSGSKSLSFDHAVLCTIPKRLLFTMAKNKDFLGSMDSNRFKFQHFAMKAFAKYVNGKQIPSESLALAPTIRTHCFR
jgi:hypothetical protein